MKLINNIFYNKNPKNQDTLTLGIILLFCLMFRLIYFYKGELYYNSDSVSYFTSSFFDLYRTPIYPLLIKLFKSISEDNYLNILIYFQQLLSFISIIPFFYLLRNTLKNKGMIILTTLVYACIPFSLDQNLNLNPECLCLVGSTLLLFLFSYYIKKPQRTTAFCIGLFPFILIMLKPAYLITLCVLFLFFVVRYILVKNEKIIIYWGILGVIIASLGILGFCKMNLKYNGEFTLSKISINNSLGNIINSGAYKYGGDEELISLIDSVNNPSASVFYLNNESIDNMKIAYEKFFNNFNKTADIEFCFSIPDIDNYSSIKLNQFIKKSQFTKIYFRYLGKRLFYIFYESYTLLSLVILLEILLMISLFLKYRKIPWMLFFCIIFTAGQLYTIAVGGLYDWYRLIFPSYPFIILIFSSFFDMVLSSKKKTIEFVQEISKNLL